MWIKKEDYERKLDHIDRLVEQNREYENKINELDFQLDQAEKHNFELNNINKNLEQVNGMQKERIEMLDNDNNILLRANQQLTEWVNKIINEVGIYDVKDRRTITIPICKNPVKAMSGKFGDISQQMPDFMAQEEIIVPEIRFIRMK